MRQPTGPIAYYEDLEGLFNGATSANIARLPPTFGHPLSVVNAVKR